MKEEKTYITNNIYKLIKTISFIYLCIILSFISFIFNKKVESETSESTISRQIFLNQEEIKNKDKKIISFNNNNLVIENESIYEEKELNSNNYINNDKNIENIKLEQYKNYILTILNSSNEEMLYNNVYSFTERDPKKINKIVKEVKSIYEKSNWSMIAEIITFEKKFGNIILNNGLKYLTESEYYGIFEFSPLPVFKTEYSSIYDSKYYNIYIKFNEIGQIKDLTINENFNFIQIEKNKNVLYLLEKNPELIYQILTKNMLDTFIITKLRTKELNSINVYGNYFKNEDIIAYIKINNDENLKYKIIINNQKIISIDKL